MGGQRGRMIPYLDRIQAVTLIQEAQHAGARLHLACKELNITLRTYQRWVQEGSVKADARPTAIRPIPKNKLSQQERNEILSIVNSEEFANCSPNQIVPTLADRKEYIASESTVYRVLRAQGMQNHRGKSKRPESKRPESFVATGPKQVWTWDITWLQGPVLGKYYRLYLIIDIFSRKVVGWEVWESEEAKYAEELIKKTIVKEEIQGSPLVLHSDNGSPMKAATFQVLLEKLGIQKSYSRPRVSNDNPYSEAMFKTLKYQPNYPSRGFRSVEEARTWVTLFVAWYNTIHYHSGLNYVTPEQVHTGIYKEILEERSKVYEAARKKRPERWSKNTRNWEPHQIVALNPIKEEK